MTALEDREWALAAARGDITTEAALDHVANIRWSPTLADDEELAAALAEGDRRDPGRVPVDGTAPPWHVDVDHDPATAEAFTSAAQGWDDPDASGAQLLDEVVDQLTRYVAFPSIETADAVALFIAATHAQTAWEHATRLVVKSPVKRCGKTRLQEVLAELAHNVLKTTNISPAALVRSIGLDDPPTIVLDEADSFFVTRRGERSEGAEDLRGLLNSGHSRGWPYIRWDATARRAESCPTFAMAVLGGIGDMPDTIEDRAVIVTMRRRSPGEHVDQFRRRRAVSPLQSLRDRLHNWARDNLDSLGAAEPELPVEDRAADVWEPLVAVAELAGGVWPDRARAACKALAGGVDDDATSNRLLADLAAVFAITTDDADGNAVAVVGYQDKVHTAVLLAGLNSDEKAPWGGWHRGDGLKDRDLAKMLKPYGVAPRKVRIGDSSLMGYRADDLHDSWSRYVPSYRGEFRNAPNMQNMPARDVPGVPGVPDKRLNLDLDPTTTDSDSHTGETP